jgi:hypothetical protein
MIRTFSLIAMLAVCTGSGAPQEARSPIFRVAIKVSGDSVVASEIESWIRHELNLLKDVDITDSKPDYTLNAIAMVVQDRERVEVGIAVTWLSLYHPKGFLEACSLVEDYRAAPQNISKIQAVKNERISWQ